MAEVGTCTITMSVDEPLMVVGTVVVNATLPDVRVVLAKLILGTFTRTILVGLPLASVVDTVVVIDILPDV